MFFITSHFLLLMVLLHAWLEVKNSVQMPRKLQLCSLLLLGVGLLVEVVVLLQRFVSKAFLHVHNIHWSSETLQSIGNCVVIGFVLIILSWISRHKLYDREKSKTGLFAAIIGAFLTILTVITSNKAVQLGIEKAVIVTEPVTQHRAVSFSLKKGGGQTDAIPIKDGVATMRLKNIGNHNSKGFSIWFERNVNDRIFCNSSFLVEITNTETFVDDLGWTSPRVYTEMKFRRLLVDEEVEITLVEGEGALSSGDESSKTFHPRPFSKLSVFSENDKFIIEKDDILVNSKRVNGKDNIFLPGSKTREVRVSK